MIDEVCSRMEGVSSRLMWVRVKIERVGCLYQHMDWVVRRVRWR